MPKEFYTETDIEDMAKRGVLSLRLNDNVVLTDLAYEAANRLGMNLLGEKPENPPAAPVRPYFPQTSLSGNKSSTGTFGDGTARDIPSSASVAPPHSVGGDDLRRRIQSAVISRLGSQVDSRLLDVIITRVLHSTGIK